MASRHGLQGVLFTCVMVTGCASTLDYPDVSDALTPGIFLDLESRATLPPGTTLRPIFPPGLRVTKVSEGWRNRLYNDAAGYCTIGYGHLLKLARCNGSERPDWRDGITESEGEALLVSDMRAAQVAVMLAITTKLTDAQYAALCDFVFNVGAANFRKSRLLQVVNAGQHDHVQHQLMRWTKAGGREFEGLRNRRQREVDLYFDGLLTQRNASPAGEDLLPLDIYTGN